MESAPRFLDTNFREILVSGKDVTDNDLRECVAVFNNSYGTWSEQATIADPRLKAGTSISMSYKLLRRLCLYDPENSYLARVFSGSELCGYAFAASWTYPGGGIVCWITQLVTNTKYRYLGVATRNLLQLKSDTFSMYGLASSHIAACITLAKCLGSLPIDSLNLDFIRTNAHNIVESTTVPYLKETVLHGSMFDDVNDGSVCSINTKFFVDHKTVLGYLREYLALGRIWPLGELIEGHEYFILVPPKHDYGQNVTLVG